MNFDAFHAAFTIFSYSIAVYLKFTVISISDMSETRGIEFSLGHKPLSRMSLFESPEMRFVERILPKS